MAKVTNAFDTYSATANREDLSGVIYNIDPFDTPFMSAIGRRNVSNVTFDWQTENLPAVSTSAELEGFELSRTVSTATVREDNICQIQKRDATVTGSQQGGNPAGKNSEMAHQMALSSKALKRDVESVLSGTNQGKTTGNASTARTTRSLESWLSTNADRAGDGADAASAAAGVTDGTQRALDEATLKSTLQTCYENGAEPTLMLVGPYNKTVVSGFTGRSQARQNIAADRIQQSVSVYASDFGEIKVVPSRWIRARNAFLLDPEYAAVAYYRNFQRKPIADIGDAKTEMLIVEFGLEMRNEAAHGVIADLTTSA
jgi:hypothetical protein